jgi:hypothetical protein
MALHSDDRLEPPPTLAGAHQSEGEENDAAAFAADTPLLASYSSIKAARQQAGAPRGCPRRVRRLYRLLGGTRFSWINTRLGVLTVAYVVTGAAQPTLTDAVRYSGGAGTTQSAPLLLPMLASTAGMAGVGLMLLCPSSCAPNSSLSGVDVVAGTALPTRWRKTCINRQIALLVVVDMVSSMLILVGLLLVGSGVYVVMCASNNPNKLEVDAGNRVGAMGQVFEHDNLDSSDQCLDRYH